MKYATVASGIEAPTVAWEPLGWEPQFFSEIEPFPNKVLKHHYPLVPNYGDMTKYKEWPDHEQLGLICGGTPCQSFSIAGLRKGLDDPRGNLSLIYLGIVARYRPRWLIWENVYGVLSSNRGRDFGSFIGGIQKIGYSFCWRVLDAQYFGVPQRRRRVFLVGYLGDWRPPFAVLFEPESLRGYSKKSKAEGQEIAPTITGGSGEDSCKGKQSGSDRLITVQGISEEMNISEEQAGPLMRSGQGTNKQGVAYRMQGFGDYEPDDKARALKSRDYKDATDLVCAVRTANTNANGHGISIEKAHTLDGAKGQCIAFQPSELRLRGSITMKDKATTLLEGQGKYTDNDMQVIYDHIVRRFTPVECERLQGFTDNYTLIPGIGRTIKKAHAEIVMYLMTNFGFSEATAKRFAMHPDNARYKALGNSMAVPVVRWIGKRIQLWEDTCG